MGGGTVEGRPYFGDDLQEERWRHQVTSLVQVIHDLEEDRRDPPVLRNQFFPQYNPEDFS